MKATLADMRASRRARAALRHQDLRLDLQEPRRPARGGPQRRRAPRRGRLPRPHRRRRALLGEARELRGEHGRGHHGRRDRAHGRGPPPGARALRRGARARGPVPRRGGHRRRCGASRRERRPGGRRAAAGWQARQAARGGRGKAAGRTRMRARRSRPSRCGPHTALLPPRMRRRVFVALAACLVLAAGYQFWLRDSSLVAVEDVTVTGLTTKDAPRVRAALVSAAHTMTTLHVEQAELERAIAAYPVVRALQVTADFPHAPRRSTWSSTGPPRSWAGCRWPATAPSCAACRSRGGFPSSTRAAKLDGDRLTDPARSTPPTWPAGRRRRCGGRLERIDMRTRGGHRGRAARRPRARSSATPRACAPSGSPPRASSPTPRPPARPTSTSGCPAARPRAACPRRRSRPWPRRAARTCAAADGHRTDRAGWIRPPSSSRRPPRPPTAAAPATEPPPATGRPAPPSPTQRAGSH